jgi:hypothetical protein
MSLYLVLPLFLFFSALQPARAEEPVQIAAIEADPDTYHLRHVTLQGRVHDMQILDPYYQPTGVACTGAYLFTLEDETGFIQVAVLGVCGIPVFRAPEVAEGDTILLKGVIHAPGRFGYNYSLEGLRRPGDSSAPLHAVANEIHKTGE